jgi:hypothetical protein
VPFGPSTADQDTATKARKDEAAAERRALPLMQ